jgi:hypothetical protein
MAGAPDKYTRDTNLDALKDAVREWVEKEQERLENENKFMREVLDGRGVSDAAARNLSEATAIAAVEISEFLTG